MPKAKFLVEHREIDVKQGRSVREVAIDEGIDIDREFFRGFNCRGHGLCGACTVWLREESQGAASRTNLRERFHGMGDGRRLACQAHIHGNVEVTTVAGGDDRTRTDRIIDP